MSVGDRIREIWGHFATRLVVGMLLASLPVTIVLAVVLTQAASSSLRAESSASGEAVARSVVLRLEDWLSERRENAKVLATHAAGEMDAPDVRALLEVIDRAGDDYSVIELVDASGQVVSASRSKGAFPAAGESWFASVLAGHSVLKSLTAQDGRLRWVLAEPILGADGTPEGAVVADLNAAALPKILDPELQHGETLTAVDQNLRLIYSSEMGNVTNDGQLLAKGALDTKLVDHGLEKALAAQTGDTSFRDVNGRDVVGGYDTVDGLGWLVTVSKPHDVVVAPVTDQQHLAIVLVLIGVGLAVAFSVWFARRTTRPILRLADAAEAVARGDLEARAEVEGATELRRLGDAFNSMVASLGRLVKDTGAASTEVNASAAELSASSEELAATTTQQSAAVTQASATTEELARASASIAETVDGVAAQAAETRENLERAEEDIQASSERTLALAERVNEIGAILTLINEIADQTNLLALNAAIEAARAGEGGRGFAVVAEEVRRLAERSKSSAAEIAEITEGVHTETNATVMAMEKGAKQMQRGLALLEDVAQATEQVRLTTQQQRSATTQVVETMDQLSDASRQVSATAQQLASASASLAGLAGNLEDTAALAGVS